jgi:phosphatidylinositol kinase/protein kinase (PI-3  family)
VASGVDLAKAPIITGTVLNRGISTRIISIKMVLAWEQVILEALTQDSRQDTIKVIMVNSMTIVATISDVVEAEAEVTMEVTAVEAINSEATPTTRIKLNSLSTDPVRMARTVSTKMASKWMRMASQFKRTVLKGLMRRRPQMQDKPMDPVRP